MQIKAIAVDDEPVALKILENHAAAIPFLRLEACFVSPAEAREYLLAHSVDLVLLDINMPGQSGLLFAARLKLDTQFIFTTAHPDYAVEAFELEATDYLLKPVSAARLLQACERALVKLNKANEKEDSYIFIKSGYELLRIRLSDLLYIRAADNYSVLYLHTEQVVTRMSLSELLKRPPPADFMRIHKSCIISLCKIEKAETDKLYIGQLEFTIAKTFRQELKNECRKSV